MKIAIIGSGISGLVSAYRLNESHEITVFEANDYIGGHTNTVQVDLGREKLGIDTGFIVFNDRTYPNFISLMDELGVASDPTSMSFSVSCDQSGWEYNGTSVNGLFSQRRNLVRPKFHRMLLDILRFNREASQLLDSDQDEEITVSQFLEEHRYSQEFANQYLLPMGAAIWSCPPQTFEQFPIRFIAEFYHNHGLLSIRNRPTWRVIRGGAHQYVKAITSQLTNRFRLNSPVSLVQRYGDHIEVVSNGVSESFDEVVFACHSDQASRILVDASATERELLGSFPYGKNTAVLHTDISVLPKRKRAWASWNYHIPNDNREHVTVTYNMNILQNIESQHVYCVTLNESENIDPKKVIRKFNYSHPIFSTRRSTVQLRHSEVIRTNRTSFCGAYWGNGFHEDGVNSAIAVSQAFEPESIQLGTTSSKSPNRLEGME